MKILLVTVAGMASRFSKSLGQECLKCIYYKNSIEETLLYRLINLNTEFDKYVIVGGFLFDELEAAIHEHFKEFEDRIVLVRNNQYAEYGSGYSLYLGLQAVLDMDMEELIFAEGDLFVDEESFQKISDSHNNVITYNHETILADKAVAFYFDKQYRIHYIYDTEHSALEIKEPFLGIFNSGQIWKFAYADHIRRAFSQIGEMEWRGTNLVFIQQYFGALRKEEYDMIGFEKWVNCNTVSDFEKIVY